MRNAPGNLKGGDERQPWRHELGPMEQGDKLRFELYEHERDSPSVHLLCSEDLLWQTRGTSIYYLDKQPASQGQRGRVYLEDLTSLAP